MAGAPQQRPQALLRLTLLGLELGAALRHRGTEEQRGPWRTCAQEGGPLSEGGLVRFGWGLAWVEASVRSGSICSVRTFGGADPAPNIRKACQCAGGVRKLFGHEERDDVGTAWVRCAAEGDSCACPGGGAAVRFGAGARWVSAAAPPQGKNLTCAARSFGGADPAPSTKKDCWCEQKHPAAKRARTAIVMLSRHPPDLKTWLQYHLDYMGVERVFIDVEDTPEFNATWGSLPRAHQQRVTVWRPLAANSLGNDGRPADDYESLQTRQAQAMLQAKSESHRLGIDWLIHIDDDELLYTPVHRPVGEVLAALPGEVDQAYIPNVEAVYPATGVRNCFTETTEVNVNRYAFASYANGKAAIRVADEGATPAGPHQWRDPTGLEPNSVHLDEEPFGAPVMVVHYESCPFSRWEDKFWELGNTSPEKVKSIPFGFYRDSIRAMQECRDPAQPPGSHKALRSGCSEDALRHFWAGWKTRANPRIRYLDRMPLEIPWAAIAAGARL